MYLCSTFILSKKEHFYYIYRGHDCIMKHFVCDWAKTKDTAEWKIIQNINFVTEPKYVKFLLD